MNKESKLEKGIKGLGMGVALMASVGATSINASAEELDSNEAIIEEENISVEDTENKDVVIEEVYDTLENAEIARDAYVKELEENNYEDITSSISEITEEVKVGEEEVLVSSETTTEKDAYTGLTLEEAEEIKSELEKDTKEEVVTVDIHDYMEDTGENDVIEETTNYDTLEDAKAAEESIREELENQGYEVETNITEKEVSVEVGTKEELVDTNVTIETYYGISEEDLEKLKEAETSNKDVTIEVKYSSYEADSGIDEVKEINETFSSLEEYNAFIKKLEEEGYDTSNITVRANTEEKEKSISETCETLEEATEKLNEFLDSYKNTTGEIVEIRDESEDTTVTETTNYETLEDAEAAAEKVISENEDKVVETNIVEKITEIPDLRDEVSETFETEEEAIEKLEELKNEGYEVTAEIQKEEVEYTPALPEINSGTTSDVEITKDNRANMFIRIDNTVQYEDGTTSYGDSYYVYAGTVAVSEEAVYDVDASNHGNDLVYLINNNNKIGEKIIATISNEEIKKQLAVYGINLTDDDVIVWYVLKNQSDNVLNRTYKDANNQSIVVTTEACSYHIDGVIRSKKALKNIFSIIGSGVKHDGYDLTTSITTPGYDYQVTGNGTETVYTGDYTATGVATKDIYETKYDATVTTTDYVYENVPVMEDVTTYDLEVNASKDIYETKYGVDVTTTINEYETRDVYETNTDYLLKITANKKQEKKKDNPSKDETKNDTTPEEKNEETKVTEDSIKTEADYEIYEDEIVEAIDEYISLIENETEEKKDETIENSSNIDSVPKTGDTRSNHLGLLLAGLSSISLALHERKKQVKKLRKTK